MDIIPLAAESLGTRATCILIRTEDQVILFDPGVSLGPRRYGLAPHLEEISAAFLSRQLILNAVKYAGKIIQSHYHGDHFTLRLYRPFEFTDKSVFPQIYAHQDKVVLAKDNNAHINYNQKKRAHWLWQLPKINIYSADNRAFQFGETYIKFSPPLPHGPVPGSWVISTAIFDSSSSVLITSDVNGPSSDKALDFILSTDVDLVILDGPSTYHPKQSSQQSLESFERIVKIIDSGRSLILDHHFLRDIRWKTILKELGILNKIRTLAEVVGIAPMCLESLRKELHENFPLPIRYHDKFVSGSPDILKEIKVASEKLPHAKLSQMIQDLNN
ncbi:MAG: MBL fold metallo-hydrolase [Candidatus Heimdallarchaeota archaeon]